jgi:predicted RNA binding protein YcfA (HicA-like mRNA interferase family)
MKSREVIVRLAADGWWKVAQKGSHIQFKRTPPSRAALPFHIQDVKSQSAR